MRKTALIAAMATFVLATDTSTSFAAAQQPTAVRHRLAIESAARDNPFLLLPHRPNYILPLTYNRYPNDEPFELEPGTLDELEMKGYLQIFDGYGESRIDYNHRVSRVGVGILLADWL
jgi:phospholipase A1